MVVFLRPLGLRLKNNPDLIGPAGVGKTKSDRSHVVLRAKELSGLVVFLRPLGLRLPPVSPAAPHDGRVPADDRYVHPQQEAFSIQLISPVSWEAIPNTR